MPYRVQLQNFEGPLDLLLFLMKKNEVEIYDIPVADIKRRYTQSLNNFLDRYAFLCDSWIIFDNSNEKPLEIVRRDNGSLKVIDQKKYQKIFKDRKL